LTFLEISVNFNCKADALAKKSLPKKEAIA